MKKRQLKKSVLALSLCGAMLLSDTGPLVEAWAEEQAEEEALAQTLLDASGQYPEGAFTIGEPQLTGTEGEKMELTILRQGAERSGSPRFAQSGGCIRPLRQGLYTDSKRRGIFIADAPERG